jgi:hypothetical protein
MLEEVMDRAKNCSLLMRAVALRRRGERRGGAEAVQDTETC